MKFLFVANTSWSLYNFRLGLMSALKEKGLNIVFCAPYDGYAEELRGRGYEYIPIRIDRKGMNPLKDLKLIFNLYKIYHREKPDLVLHFTIKPNIYGSIAAKLARVKCINTVTGLGYVFIKEGLLSKFVKFLYKVSFKFPEKIFFQNKDDLEIFLKNKIINSENKAILVKGSGINTDYFSPNFCERIKKTKTDFVFLFIGRFLWDKGIGELAEAAKILKEKYPSVRFWLLGSIDKGNPSAIPEKKIKEWQNSALLEFFGEKSDVRPFICRSDCVVLPSYREGIPRSLLEAASMGKAIITTNSSGCKDVVDDGINGFLVPLRDSGALADAMVKMIELTGERRREMGRHGRIKILEGFSEKDVTDIYSKTIREIKPKLKDVAPTEFKRG